MSVGVVVMNKRGVAIAADSAMTLERSDYDYKVLPSANKIHLLSSKGPVAVVHAGSAHFMEFPWETAFGAYHRIHGAESFGSLLAHGTNFIEFLRSYQHFCGEERQKDYVRYVIEECLEHLRSQIWVRILAERRDKRSKELEREKEIARQYIMAEQTACASQPCDDSFPDAHDGTCRDLYFDDYEVLHSEICWPYAKEIFEEKEFKALSEPVWDIVLHWLKRNPDRESGTLSQLTMVGYGDHEEFPSLVEYSIHGIANGHLKVFQERIVPVDFLDAARIEVIGQGDVVQNFVYGADSDVLSAFTEALARQLYPRMATEILDSVSGISDNEKQELLEKYQEPDTGTVSQLTNMLIEFSVAYSKDSIMTVVEHLSIIDLASIADKLADLTSFRRQISTDRPTVGGPIDVALLSKDGGFRWFKQKGAL
ncbi:MAG: hypothetical protein ACOYXY_01420 [Thermodesulfobacteriota bacterium]